MNHGEIVSFLWGVADLIRDTFKRGKCQDVILPLTVLRRLDCVLAPTKQKVLDTNKKLKGKGVERTLQDGDALVRKVQDGIDRLKEYRTALVSAAVKGKIDVRDQVAA